MDLFLSKIPEDDKKKSFLEEFRSNKSRKDMEKLLEKYNVVLSEEEIKQLHDSSAPRQFSAEDLKNVAGGDRCDCWGGGICSCSCCYWY